MAAVARSLRIVTIATFLPAFALCLAHGIVTKSPVPAVGLVPLAFSSGTSIFLLARHAKKKHQQQHFGSAGEETRTGGRDDYDNRNAAEPQLEEHALTHSVLVFVVDAVLAAALMVVLAFTWVRNGASRRGGNTMVMLASYATIPLLVNL